VTDQETIIWVGASGKKYKYWIYAIGTEFSAVAANYIFAKETSTGKYSPIYIGQTGDLSERFDSHHKMSCIKSYGATHIHSHTNVNEQDRLDEEADLISNYNTPCNG